MIRAQEFRPFVGEMYEQINDRAMWEFFVGKVHDKSFGEWREEVLPKAQPSIRSGGTEGAYDAIADSLHISNIASAKEVTGT